MSDIILPPSTESATFIEEKVRVYIRQRPFESTVDANTAAYSVSLLSDGSCRYLPQRSSVKGSVRGYDANNLASMEKIFQYTGVFDYSSTQEAVYLEVAKPLVDSVLTGFSATIIAYGSTSTGKTHTIRGDSSSSSQLGIMPRCVEQVLSHINDGMEVYMSYLQIYCEVITDLFTVDHITKLHLRENEQGMVYVEGLTRLQLMTVDDFREALLRGDNVRKTASTNMNETSSRSHAVCIIMIKRPALEGSSLHSNGNLAMESSLVLVDLAGSERAEANDGRNYMRFEEMKAINLSLSSLGNCISALVDGRKHVPYRDSQLTRLLQSSLGGKSRLSIIATIAPGPDDTGEILNTLRFAARASRVTVKAKISQVVDYEKLYNQLQAKHTALTNTISDLEHQLQEKTTAMDEQGKETEDLRMRASILEEQVMQSNAASSKLVSANSTLATAADTKAFEDHVSSLRSRHDEEINAFKRKYDARIAELKDSLRTATDRESTLQISLMKEKQQHLGTLKDYRVVQENAARIEDEATARREEMLAQLQDRQREIDDLSEQLIALSSYAKKTSEALEVAEQKMTDMVSVQQVKEMESLFMETVTRLTDRVKQLETQRQPSRDASMIREPMATNMASDAQAYQSRSSGSSTLRLEPGGRIRR